MSNYFWSAVDYVYNNRVTPSEGVKACGAGAGVGGAESGNAVGAGLGCMTCLLYEIFSKMLSGERYIPMGNPIATGPGLYSFEEGDIPHVESNSNNSCPHVESNGNNSCPYYEGSDFCNPNPVSNSEFPTCGENGGTCPLPESDFGPSFTFGNNSDSWPTVSGGYV